MRSLLIIAAMAATIPCGMAVAQSGSQTDQTTVQTTVTPDATVNIAPPAPSSVPTLAPTTPAASGSGSIDSGGLQFAPAQEIVESAPPAAQSYPLCTRTRQDSCKNPDPSKELPYYRAKN